MRAAALVAVVALVVTACGGGEDVESGDRGSGAAGDAPTVTVDRAAESPREDVPSALDAISQDGLPEPLIDGSDLIDGGPPPDGIPAIDEPTFHRAGDVDFLAEDEPVLAVEVDGEARAYPVQVMIWHEIVNDTLSGTPVAVTYCPLCNTAVGVERTLDDGRVLSFGTSGRLFRSSLVMYDRQTESLWTHVDGRAVAGTLTGTELPRVPVQTVAWSTWRDRHPDGLVLSRETGHDRDYGRNPYPGYDDVGSDPFLFDGEPDGRLPAKERVVGFASDEQPTAVRLAPLLEDGVLATEVAGRPVVVWAARGTSSALDGATVDAGRDVGATGVFVAEHDGTALTFRRARDGFVDEETGSRWNVLGEAVQGPLDGARLTPLAHVDTFWFAWAAFSPDTRVLPDG